MLIIIIILTILYFAIGIYFFNIALNPKISKKYILRDLTSSEDRKNVASQNPVLDEAWLQDMSEEIILTTDDKLKIYGYQIKNPIRKSDVWVILVHGYMGKASEMVPFAKEFITMGYNTLLVDLRAHGKSQGKYIGMGWQDKNDIVQWTDYLQEKYSACNIILYGVSMGAATVMMATGESLPENVKACIEDCGYTSVWAEFKSLLSSIHPVLANIALSATSMVGKIKLGYHFKKASSIEQIKKARIPILFIHGSKDKFVPFPMLEELYNAATGVKRKLIVEEAHHVESSKINPERYWKTIKEFIEKEI